MFPSFVLYEDCLQGNVWFGKPCMAIVSVFAFSPFVLIATGTTRLVVCPVLLLLLLLLLGYFDNRSDSCARGRRLESKKVNCLYN